MYNKKLRKIYAGCALTLALTMAAAPVSAFAENKEVNSVNPGKTDEEKATKAAEETKLSGINPTAEDDTTTTENEAYVDTDIDVWGYTNDATIYSVDVEWGAMTFEFEASSWDPETHKSTDGRGWLVYDNAADKVIGEGDEAKSVQDAINRVTITNHSNAPVYAKLTYTGETSYSDTSGTFTKSANADTEDVKATWDETNKFFTLATAATDKDGAAVAAGAAGEPSVGNVYFKPDGIGTNQEIEKWTKIGKITVAITTTDPTPVSP